MVAFEPAKRNKAALVPLTARDVTTVYLMPQASPWMPRASLRKDMGPEDSSSCQILLSGREAAVSVLLRRKQTLSKFPLGVGSGQELLPVIVVFLQTEGLRRSLCFLLEREGFPRTLRWVRGGRCLAPRLCDRPFGKEGCHLGSSPWRMVLAWKTGSLSGSTTGLESHREARRSVLR